ncbi:MAG TPA: aspartate aminotransferase family protein [Vicinamibacteria bacterium]|nr:aspartate aminotransferase family protein [Vicinamibacteria bacterium]
MASKDLTLDREEMTRLGYRAIDLVVSHFEKLPQLPVSRVQSREDMERALREPPPREPSSADAIFDTLSRHVLPNIIHVDHPRNFAFVPGPNNFAGVLGSLIASGFNVFAGTWLEASGPAQIELVTIDWMKEILGLPGSAAGLFVSGGSAANLTALLVAREDRLSGDLASGMGYCSSQTHSSMERAFRVLGLRPHQLTRVETDEVFRLSLPALERAIALDRARGRKPFVVIANAGTTNTGAVDPLPELAELCRKEDLWLHVDGSFGAVAALSPRKSHLLRGLDRADSLSLDPHKWLFQPYGTGTVLVRQGNLLERYFQVFPEYLDDVKGGSDELNFCDYGIELTRSFRALRLWMTFKLFGLDRIQAAVEHGIEMAERAEAGLREIPLFEIVAPAELGVVAFRYRAHPPARADELNRRLVRAVMDDGFAFVSSTTLGGKTVIRLCPINPRTTAADIDRSVERICQLAARLD